MLNDIVKHIIIDAPIDAVWAYIAEKDKMEDWMLTVTQAPKLGETFSFLGEPGPDGKWCGRIDCKVLEMEAPHHIKYTWTHNMLGWEETTVTIDLADRGESTELMLVHAGWDEITSVDVSEEHANHDKGWDNHLNIWSELVTGKSELTWMDLQVG